MLHFHEYFLVFHFFTPILALFGVYFLSTIGVASLTRRESPTSDLGVRGEQFFDWIRGGVGYFVLLLSTGQGLPWPLPWRLDPLGRARHACA